MKKVLGILAFLVLMASSVVATDLNLNPDLVTMDTTDTKVISACLIKSGGGPHVGADLVVETYCKDMNNNEVCDSPPDISLPSGFSAVVTQTPTNSSGCGEVTLTTSSAATGVYAYKVNGEDGGVIVASEHGIALIPEFTTIGAVLVLAGAGLFIHRKQRK